MTAVLPDVVCRLCDPRADRDTTTYCARCTPIAAPAAAMCGCGKPLLLARPGRDQCARCHLGHAPTPMPEPTPRPDDRELCGGCGRLTGIADGRCITCRASTCADCAAAHCDPNEAENCSRLCCPTCAGTP